MASRAGRVGVRGMTLVEIMIVLGILAVLAAIIIPNVLKGRAQAQLNSCQENLNALSVALQQYALENGHDFPASLSDLVSQYIKELPTCPSSGVGYGYETSSNSSKYTAYCTAGHRAVDPAIDPGYPQYSTRGLTVKP